MSTALAAVRNQVAFYASTPAYAGVLELHGWGDLAAELNALSVSGRAGPVAGDGAARRRQRCSGSSPWWPSRRTSPARSTSRFGGLVDRITFYAPYDVDPAVWQPALEQLRAVPATTGSRR